MRSMSYVTVLIAATVLGVSCERVKSANPLSPLAGPIAGVDITVPHLLKPETGEKFKPTQQPVTLIFENAATTSPRPLYYTIEIAADSSFNNMVVRRTNLAPGEGRTQYTLEGSLALGHTYFWRARGEDGANSGEYSPVRHFEVQQPVVIQAPIPDSPTGGETIGNRRPTLTVNNAGRSGPTRRSRSASGTPGRSKSPARHGCRRTSTWRRARCTSGACACTTAKQSARGRASSRSARARPRRPDRRRPPAAGRHAWDRSRRSASSIATAPGTGRP
jgi:hypothetical protein